MTMDPMDDIIIEGFGGTKTSECCAGYPFGWDLPDED